MEDYKHNMKDHDLLITIHALVNQMKISLDTMIIKVDQKADKVDVSAVNSRVDNIEKRMIHLEESNHEDRIRKDEIGRIANWGWQVWAKVIGAIFFLITVWQAFQNNNSKLPTVIVQTADGKTATSTK